MNYLNTDFQDAIQSSAKPVVLAREVFEDFDYAT